VGAEAIERLREAAAPLQGLRVAHLTAAGSRLRSTDLLPSLLSLYGDLGLGTECYALAGERPLWRLVRQLEDGIQGGETAIDDEVWDDYVESVPSLEGFDVIVIHGPGALGMAANAGCIWRPELDHTHADPDVWGRLTALAEPHDLPEAIDPLAPGSVDLPVRLAGSMLRSAGVDLSKPCCCQIRPFDTWQDPHEVLDAFELAHEEVPKLQLVLAGDPSRGDIEAWRLLREVSDYADTREGVLLLSGPAGLGNTELNALRTIARAALESTIGGAPATTTLETLWKGTPVIREDTPEVAAARLVELVRDPGLAIELGAAGRELVRERHLITTLAENELRLLASFQSA
jgi:trehalose synthase